MPNQNPVTSAAKALLSLSLVAVVMPPGARAAAATSTAQVTVNAGAPLGTIPTTAVGLNTAVWDGNLLDASLPNLVKYAGVRVLRFPGGSTSDVYHWQTNTVIPGQGYANPNNTFDAFMGVAHQAGAQALITANYGSGTPAEAASWVRYANVTKGYGVQYWEIGNEVYGNGTYGSAWEYDDHGQRGATAYATNAAQYISAMKAADPTIKVGVVLTAPGNWPDGIVASQYGDTMDWNDTVLSALCAQIDFVVVHWYPQGPGSETDAGLLGSTSQIAGMVSTLREEIGKWCGSHAGQVQIMVTETNSVSYNPGKQTVGLVNALFLADNYMDWLENGVANVDWWDAHNGPITGTDDSSSLYGTADYGDYGLLSSGLSPEPPLETPFPPYYGLRMLSKLGKPGDQMVQASSTQSLIAVHAVKQANGDLAVLLINKDPSTTYRVTVALQGYTPRAALAVYSYGMNSTTLSAAHEQRYPTNIAQAVPPYSLTTMVMAPRT